MTTAKMIGKTLALTLWFAIVVSLTGIAYWTLISRLAWGY